MLEDRDWLDNVYFPTNLQRLVVKFLAKYLLSTNTVSSAHISLVKAARGFPDSEAKTGEDECGCFGCSSWALLLGGLQVFILDPRF